jgi:hypothetical protein
VTLTAVETAEGVVFSGAVPPGRVAYVDASSLDGAAEAMAVDAGGPLDDRGLNALGALAGPILEALAAAAGPLEVPGDGALATFLRAQRPAPDGAERPAVVVELTGRAEAILGATTRVRDLGTVILARDPVAPIDLDLYPDVHVRGLRLVGSPPPSGSAARTGEAPAGVEAPVDAAPGTASVARGRSE